MGTATLNFSWGYFRRHRMYSSSSLTSSSTSSSWTRWKVDSQLWATLSDTRLEKDAPCFFLGACCLSQNVCYRMFVTDCLSQTVCHRLFVTDCLLQTVTVYIVLCDMIFDELHNKSLSDDAIRHHSPRRQIIFGHLQLMKSWWNTRICNFPWFVTY